MEAARELPLPAAELPESIRKFGDPAAPAPARTMAARGLVPVKGHDLITLLVQLANDPTESIASAAGESLAKVPDGVLHAACEAPLHRAILDDLARRFRDEPEALSRIAQNHATGDATIAAIAHSCDEEMCEIIAVNQQRLLGAPDIIEALYKNPRTRMSTADRIIELAARNGVDLPGIPSYRAHVEAIQGQLIPEPSDEPLPDDLLFSQALGHDAEDVEAIELDVAEGTEQVKEKYIPLREQIRQMLPSQKIRLATIGSAAARLILVRDPNRAVSHAAISSPGMTVMEAVAVSHSKEVSEEVLRYVGNKREWARSYEVKRALIHNPKTPIGISLRYLQHLRDNDLKEISRSRNVPPPVKTAAQQRIDQKTKRK
jgi:hypothetical protein